jgi:hypothetical protein
MIFQRAGGRVKESEWKNLSATGEAELARALTVNQAWIICPGKRLKSESSIGLVLVKCIVV